MGAPFFDRPPVTAPRYVFRPPFTLVEDDLVALHFIASHGEDGSSATGPMTVELGCV